MTTLPRLDPRRHMARAHAVRLVLTREIALERQLARVIAAVGRKAADLFARAGSSARLDFRPPIARVLTPSITATARAFGGQVAAKSVAFGHEVKLFEDLDQEVERFIAEHAASRVVQISDSLKATIAEIVRRGLAEGQSTEVVAQAIVEATSGEMSMGRARRIARTETHTAAQVGQYGAARASPFKFRKTWLATEDQRTREDHAAANGQQVDLDEPFVVGGEELMFPGDPNGSPGNVINCRCVCIYDPVPATELETPDDGEETRPADLLDDPELWRAWFDQLRAAHVIPNDVTLYATGEDCGLTRFGSEEDFSDLIGEQLDVPLTASISPVLVEGGSGLQDTFPLFGRPVVVKIKVPAGTPADMGIMVAMEVRLRGDVRIVVTGVSEQSWGEVQQDAGVPIDIPRVRHYRRMPPRRGVTLVEAEVQE